MLMYGNSKNVIKDGNTIAFNITSMNESYPRLSRLLPPNSIGYLSDWEFDNAYMQFIFNNDPVFFEFFQIVFPLYQGKNVYLVMDDTLDWSENLLESLLKVIQQRYGYNAVRINEYNDYLEAKSESLDDFNPYFGVQNLDIDKERYSYLYQLQNMGRHYYGQQSV